MPTGVYGKFGLGHEEPWSHRTGEDREALTARGPFRAILFFLMLSIASSGIAVLPSLMIGVTSMGSQETGA